MSDVTMCDVCHKTIAGYAYLAGLAPGWIHMAGKDFCSKTCAMMYLQADDPVRSKRRWWRAS